MRVAIGRVADLPDDRCVPVADGAAVVVRAGDEIRAYRNRCLHAGSSLAGGWVRDGVLWCPLHFWRYELDTGRLVGGSGLLSPVPVDVVDGECFVDVPEPEVEVSFRERQLRHAAEWKLERHAENGSTAW